MKKPLTRLFFLANNRSYDTTAPLENEGVQNYIYSAVCFFSLVHIFALKIMLKCVIIVISFDIAIVEEYYMQSFRIKNIKSFMDSGEIKIKPITILVGQNSCGKSSLLRFPAVLAQTANYVGSNPPISFFGENIDYGNFEDVVFGKEGNEISFSLSYKVDVTGNTRISTDFSGSRVLVGSRKGIGKASVPVVKTATINVVIRSEERRALPIFPSPFAYKKD